MNWSGVEETIGHTHEIDNKYFIIAYLCSDLGLL